MSLIGLIGLIGLISLWPLSSSAQIKIGGNVYGGGNKAEVKGSTKVTVKSGDIGAVLDPNASRPLEDPQGRVFGGARMANVGGNAFVHIDGESEPATGVPNYILINQVYGGNDIAGQIGTGTVPTELEEVGVTEKKNNIDNTFNTFVHISTKVSGEKYTQADIDDAGENPDHPAYGKTPGVDDKPAADARKIYIGQLFGGGNGDFTYLDENGDSLRDGDDYIAKQGDIIIARSKAPLRHPEQDKTYLEIKGGSIVYGYGGGNNATVKKETVIHFDNPSAVVNHILVTDGTGAVDAGIEAYAATYTDYVASVAAGAPVIPSGYEELLNTERFKEMGINLGFSQPSSGAFQVGRFFGGNNKAVMSIQPTWNLLAGKIRNLYSGGNRGAMTSPTGLLLEIKDYSTLIVDNLYGGCRMADVKPTVNGEYSPCTNLPGYSFPNELSARVLVKGGHINNVYGGNDVTGTVYGGNAVGIYTTVYGNVYGGGNGAYPYTDNEYMANDDTYGDLYYEGGNSTMDSLRAFRPNAEQVSIRLKGKAANNQTIIRGSVFVGGNCASLNVKKLDPLIEVKMGSHVVCDNVYLGNNGESMLDTTYLKLFADPNFNSWTLTDPVEFSNYMEGVAMTKQPRIVFDDVANDDPDSYEQYSSYVGSFFCGGNVGSMAIPGKMTFSIDSCLNIYNKFVGGCNNADVPASSYNAFYEGGIIGSKEERNNYTDGSGNIKDRLEINFKNLVITPLRWNDTFTNVYTKNGNVATKLTKGKEYYYTNLRSTKFIADGTETADATHTYYELTTIGNTLEWNTAKWSIPEDNFIKVENASVDSDTRLLEGNIYGGCYNSGHVNGNIVLNIDEDVLKRDDVFGTGHSDFLKRDRSGVTLIDQRDDVMAVALSVFGAGHGEKTEVWGSTTANLNKGYTLQIFGGGEQGVVGKRDHDANGRPIIDGEGNYSYAFDSRYSTTVNLNGKEPVFSKDGVVENLAEAEYLYGGGNEGLVCGNTLVNLGNGRIYDAFGGSSDADVLGHTEVYIGRKPNGSGGYIDAFPFIRDIIYGGNDFGGTIYGEYEDGYDFTKRVKNYATDKTQLHGYKADEIPELLKSSSYVEYLQGRVDTIFGGGYGAYDYTNDELYGEDAKMPDQESAYVNIRPKDHAQNALKAVFGGGTGYPANRDDDKAQNRSYILVDIPDGMKTFSEMEVFGAGSYNGIGMGVPMSKTFAEGYDRDSVSAIIDLLHGEIGTAYGGSYNEGNTCRTVVNVPAESTIKIKNIFGGAYGTRILPPCDVIQSIVNYNNISENAQVTGAIYGGNNNERRTIFTNVNISSTVWSNKERGYLGTVYGAGLGFDTWAEHTQVNLLNGAKVYEVYGGGKMGHVLNAESVQKYMQSNQSMPSANICAQAPWNEAARWDDGVVGGTVKEAYRTEWDNAWKDAWSLGTYYTPNAEFDNYFNTFAALKATSLVRKSEIDVRDYTGYSNDEKAKRENVYSTNVIINEGAEVVNYAYGGGLGEEATLMSGDVWGHTYIALLGGKVRKDIYAAGTTGAVDDGFAHVGAYNASTNQYGFTASATAYIKGGTCRNVYGGGWKGNVGYHDGSVSDIPDSDVPGETHVVIGDLNGSSFVNGIPAVQRNAYGGGEGGAVYGTANLTINNGYVGYEYKDGEYVEKIEDDTQAMPNTKLEDAGCLFGGGYIDNSTVDKTNVILNGGYVRNSVFGGGEIAAIGRGDTKAKASGSGYELKGIYRPGKTHVEMYSGHVLRNVFGGGRGYDNLGRVGSLNCAGYIFGQTEVHVHGGEIGTAAGLAKGDGNVFGGGDVGHVYSAYENADGTFGKGVKRGERYDGVDNQDGYYYKHAWADDGAFDSGYPLTEDCKVLVEPMCKVNIAIPGGIDGTNYSVGDFVPVEKLNKLKDKNNDAAAWSCLDETGIIIHNAVFAGGNNPPGSSATSANTASVFGNATASIHDVFHRDLITLGTGHTGGLYGDGNLTLVDGYRELNITNYGTDYYSIKKEITIDEYHDLPEREAAYYELRYTCLKDCKDKEDTQYHKAGESSKASTITADELQTLFLERDGEGNLVSVTDGGTAILIYNDKTYEWEPNPLYWEESGVLPVYAGRLMNSIQRADFCGVFGSRMVMQGAQDRVPDEVDYTNYTINRVREVSLNKLDSKITSDLAIPVGDPEYYNKRRHGNYFGIYNIVNHLGALTSDVDFGDDNTRTDARTTDNTDTGTYQVTANGQAYNTASFYDWKKEFHLHRKRNNGNSHNKVALASGVYLEITTEKSTGPGLYEKDWGPITGVVELDLINVSPGIGGGFVYAQNIHGKRKLSGKTNTILTDLNKNDGTPAVTYKKFQYDDTSEASHYTHDDVDGHYKTQWQSSGNFVHSTQTIIDDCYNISNRYLTGYKGAKGVPAHYWYIKGTTYVYDQYISAYTGSSNAYSEAVEIPLTIAAASHGKMKLLEVKPNRYAYYSAPGVKLESGKKVVINDKTYYANDPISYWDWFLLSKAEKELFVEKTYTNCVSVSIDNDPTVYEPGTLVMTEAEYSDYGTHTYKDAEGEIIKDANDNTVGKDYIFRESNNASHDTGYLLTYEVNNPSKWDTWFTPKVGDSYTNKIDSIAYKALTTEQKANYEDGPTYRLKAASGGTMLGQQSYAVGDLISKNIEDTYKAVAVGNRPGGQATFEPAYIVTNKITVTEEGIEHSYYPGSTVSETFGKDPEYSSSCEEAYICTKTVQLSKDDLILKGSKMTKAEWQTQYDKYNKVGATDAEKKIAADLLANVVPAYYCTTAGLYGGNYYVAGNNYRGLEAWSSMSATDREQFVFNYDALDLLIDPSYSKTGNQKEGQKYQYDGEENGVGFTTETQAQTNAAHYSLETSVDYTATYNGGTGDKSEVVDEVTKYYMETTAIAGGKVYVGDELTREEFEALPNEQRHYAPIAVTDPGKYYVVNTAFQVGATPYAVGSTISSETYASLPDKSYVTELTIDDAHKNQTYYYCREDYTGTGEVTAISSTDIPGAGGGVSGSNVQYGTLITYSQYKELPNSQKNFTIHGISPSETSTLFVSRESDIYDLSKEKIITVVYQYDYEESDGSGNVTPVSERHVLNIHLQFKSGVPIVEDIEKPDLILPGWLNTMRVPDVTPGAYEVTGGGWELFETETDAERHSNGVEYDPTVNPLYWYQNGYYVAYYAKSYLGRTYSNHVPVSVANYHDLADVMSDANKEHHMYIDNSGVKREPKIYINDYSGSGKNGLDLFKKLYDLSVLEGYSVDEDGLITDEGDFTGHKPLNNRVKGGAKLEFFLRTDLSHADDPAVPNEWTSIASGSKPCFQGTLHGDGHTIHGLDNSLFDKLCGSVYNLGVTGSFNTAGIVNTGDGYVESCWVKTTNETPLGTKPYAVFGAPSDDNGYQVVNSYFLVDNKGLYNIEGDDPAVLDYKETITSGGDRGKATAKSDTAFYNGELAYDLNNFYLYKRYSDHQGLGSGVRYDYFTIGEDNKPELHMDQYYVENTNAKYCSSGTGSGTTYTKYVEDRFADGDFRYAAGEIPDAIDERHWIEVIKEEGKPDREEDRFSPIYPDDYIFFGQKLTYGWAAQAHQNVPTAVAREDGRLSTGDDANRVYRAPAYYRSKVMGMTHFNPHAYLAQKEKLSDEQIEANEKAVEESRPEDVVTPRDAYPNMTAIDFKGHNESAYNLGLQDGWFYTPLLDDDGLLSIQNCDETQNIVVYAPAADANAKTYGVLNSYFTEPDYSEDNTKGYRLVAEAPVASVHGHLVQSDKTTTTDHLLVDHQDFNAPIAYTLGAEKRMWYQRLPLDKEYVNLKKGWQGISIPFTAELVTTDQKGEITHFYSGSNSVEGSVAKIGHEYWLRELTNNDDMTLKSAGVLEADFHYPSAAGAAKNVANTFLWDYYYKNTDVHNQKDKNADTYQTYYNSSRTYNSYPLLTKATPYILGLPGSTYYEFDLSGNFEAKNTAVSIPKLGKQIITFASDKGIGIGVSDDEMTGTTVKYNSTNYTFKPSYMNYSLEADGSNFALNADGNSYAKVTGAAKSVGAFRPYFKGPAASPSRKFVPERIVLGGDFTGLEEEQMSMLDGNLEIYVANHRIITTSHLKEPLTICIMNVGGITLANYVLQPGETRETRIQNTGVYIVNKKKVLVQ